MLLPLEGAARAKSFKIPVYTIALGTPEGVVEFNRFGGTRIIPVPPDPATLRQIAATTGGRFYEAESVGDLREAYEKMGSLVSKVERKQEVTYAFVAGGLVLLLAAAAIARRHVPEASVRSASRSRSPRCSLAGCSGGDDESTPATTATRTVTVSEPAAAEPAPDASAAGSLADVVERVLPSVVNVRTKSFGGGEGDGSGVVLDRAGIIVTNNHVVEGTTSVTVVFNDDRHTTSAAGHRDRDVARARPRGDPRRRERPDPAPRWRAPRRCGSATPSSPSASRSGSAGRA